MSDRIAVFNDGGRAADTPSELYDCPKNSFVAGFIGAEQQAARDRRHRRRRRALPGQAGLAR